MELPIDFRSSLSVIQHYFYDKASSMAIRPIRKYQRLPASNGFEGRARQIIDRRARSKLPF